MIMITINNNSTLLHRFRKKISDYSFFNHHLKHPVMQNPVSSLGSIFKTSPYQAETKLDVKDTLFEI